MTARRWLLAIWVCFLARTAFYSAALPLWEGFDEWSHFAAIRRMALRGELLVPRNSAVPRDVATSLELAPVPWALRGMPPPSVTQDAYWRLPASERARREAAFDSMPARWAFEDSAGTLTAYEALQPPLYGWIMVPVLRAARSRGLADEVLWLRWVSSLIGSLAIPLVFLVGRSVFRCDSVALGCAAVVAAMPEFAFDVARVGNECLAVVLFTLLTWLIVETVSSGLSYRRAASLGVVFGLGLLTKAYFLAALPVIALLVAWAFWRPRGSAQPLACARRSVPGSTAAPNPERERGASSTGRLSVLFGALIIAAASFSIAGWWYIRNLRTTGTLSGLSEAVMLGGTHQTAILMRAGEVHWARAVDTILLSHLWFGGWSGLTVRSWMYHLFYALVVLAAIGLVRAIRQPAVAALAVVYAGFWIGQLYNVLLLFLTKGLSGSMGWYMYAVVAAEVALCVAGLRALSPPKWRWSVPFAGASLFALLDLYTVHCVAAPYYTGVIAHRANGALAAFHFHDLAPLGVSGALARLDTYKATIVSQPLLVALWAAYLLATLALPAVCFVWRRDARCL